MTSRYDGSSWVPEMRVMTPVSRSITSSTGMSSASARRLTVLAEQFCSEVFPVHMLDSVDQGMPLSLASLYLVRPFSAMTSDSVLSLMMIYHMTDISV